MFCFGFYDVGMMAHTQKNEEREDNVPSEKLCPMWVALIGLPCHRNTKITTYLKKFALWSTLVWNLYETVWTKGKWFFNAIF